MEMESKLSELYFKILNCLQQLKFCDPKSPLGGPLIGFVVCNSMCMFIFKMHMALSRTRFFSKLAMVLASGWCIEYCILLHKQACHVRCGVVNLAMTLLGKCIRS